MFTKRSATIRSVVANHRLDLVLVILIVTAVELLSEIIRFDRPTFSFAALSLVGGTLSIFLVFRVNEGYARWWEARILWGSLVNESRTFARQVIGFVGDRSQGDPQVNQCRREIVYRHIAFVNALRLSLRDQTKWHELAGFLSDTELQLLINQVNKPTQLLQMQALHLAEAFQRGYLDSFKHATLEGTLSRICDTQGGCERIKRTVFPDNVSLLTLIAAWGLAILIPICLIAPGYRFDVIDLFVVPVMMMMALVTERISRDLKSPFANRPGDTPLTALCRTIEIDLRQQLGQEDLPPPEKPVRGVLM